MDNRRSTGSTLNGLFCIFYRRRRRAGVKFPMSRARPIVGGRPAMGAPVEQISKKWCPVQDSNL